MRALVGAELRLLARSPYAIVMAGVLPAALALLVLWAESDTGKVGWGATAGIMLVSLVAFTAYTGGTTALAARRRQFVLKRLRTSGLPDAAVLAGVLAPLFLVTLAQAVVLVGIMTAAGHRPPQPWPLAVAALAGAGPGCVLAVATATVTSGPEVAQLTTTPIALAFFGGGMWVAMTPAADVSWAMLAVPGVPVAHIARAAWDDGSIPVAAVAALVVLMIAVGPAAVRTFTWDPRP